MADITASMIKELRERTQAGMLDCKKALAENDGDMEKAAEFLRKKGLAKANKRAGREAKEGTVFVKISDDKKKGIILEMNCETDFVAKNDDFKKLGQQIIDEIDSKNLKSDEVASTMEDTIKNSIATTGENMAVGQVEVFETSGEGVISYYIHNNNKIGVLVEVGADSADTAAKPEAEELGREVAMQAAAAMPQFLNSDEIPEDVKNKEKEIFMDQMKDSGKPENILEKIVEGKLRKYFSEVCLVDQEFIKDSGKKVSDVVKDYGNKAGGSFEIKRYKRIQIGG